MNNKLLIFSLVLVVIFIVANVAMVNHGTVAIDNDNPHVTKPINTVAIDNDDPRSIKPIITVAIDNDDPRRIINPYI